MNLSNKTISKIVEDLEAGFACYVHKKKDKYIKLPNVDFDEYLDATGDDLRKSKKYKKLKKKRKKYIEILPNDSHEEFKVIEDFVAEIADDDVQSKFSDLLSKKRPFNNFKLNLEIYGLLEDWYAFKKQAYKEKVLEEIVE